MYLLPRAGSLRRLKPVEEALPPPGPGEVTVAVRAIGLNFADVFSILGLYRAAPRRNCVPGIEFSGVVEQSGPGAAAFRPGDRVMGAIRFGAYATHVTVGERYLLPTPADWTDEEGAGFIVQALTAYYALTQLGSLRTGQTVLIHSAAGGVGIQANRIAKRLGAFTIGTIGSAGKADLLRREGYDRVIVRGRRFGDQLREALGGRQLHLVLDSIGGRIQRESYRALTETGRLVAYGLSEFNGGGPTPGYLRIAWRYLTMPRYSTLRLIEWNKAVLGFNLIWLYDRVEILRGLLEEISALHLPKPHIGAVFPFARLPEAVRALQSGSTVGKVVVRIP